MFIVFGVFCGVWCVFVHFKVGFLGVPKFFNKKTGGRGKKIIMCSTFKYKNIMGRNFDYDESYNEEIRLIPCQEYGNKYTIVGMCTGLIKDYPLLYDGMNDKGLCVSALAFEGNAYYEEYVNLNDDSVPVYDFTFHILGNYESVESIVDDLKKDKIKIDNRQYNKVLPNSDLHWLICDEQESIVVESTIDGLQFYKGDVLTNNPPYPLQVDVYDYISEYIGETDFTNNLPYKTRGLETFNVCGDYTSMGRFERLVYLKSKVKETKNNNDNIVSTSIHLLSSVEQINGLTPVDDKYEYTIYSIIYDMSNLMVYLKFYDDLTYNSIDYIW